MLTLAITLLNTLCCLEIWPYLKADLGAYFFFKDPIMCSPVQYSGKTGFINPPIVFGSKTK